MKIINFDNKKIAKSWVSEEIPEDVLMQAEGLTKLPTQFRHVALMPDAHLGYGMPIGGILATEKIIVPNAVGVDIGCGMIAQKTTLNLDEVNPYLKSIIGEIRKVIPVGFNHHKEDQKEWLTDQHKSELWGWSIIESQYKSSLNQLGTLGGGNHFIEIQVDEENNIWIMIHSGSRNIGYKVAEYYHKLAKELNEKWLIDIDKDLAYFPINSDEGERYIAEMNYCVEFALKNRALMLKRIIDAFNLIFAFEISDGDFINIAHNYARMENHFGKNVMIHRKGATSARLGEVGIIPGSQGTSSYIVEGLGNKESFESCSHGAGRQMGRKAAQKNLNLETEQKLLNEMGIIHSVRTVNDLDEAPGAYKDIDTVMESQKDLVKIVTKLRPLAVVKG